MGLIYIGGAFLFYLYLNYSSYDSWGAMVASSLALAVVTPVTVALALIILPFVILLAGILMLIELFTPINTPKKDSQQ